MRLKSSAVNRICCVVLGSGLGLHRKTNSADPTPRTRSGEEGGGGAGGVDGMVDDLEREKVEGGVIKVGKARSGDNSLRPLLATLLGW